MNEQARRSSPPNRVRYPTDRQFALGCSPPRLAATQLPSATELWLSPAWTFTMLLWRLHGRTHTVVIVVLSNRVELNAVEEQKMCPGG